MNAGRREEIRELLAEAKPYRTMEAEVYGDFELKLLDALEECFKLADRPEPKCAAPDCLNTAERVWKLFCPRHEDMVIR